MPSMGSTTHVTPLGPAAAALLAEHGVVGGRRSGRAGPGAASWLRLVHLGDPRRSATTSRSETPGRRVAPRRTERPDRRPGSHAVAHRDAAREVGPGVDPPLGQGVRRPHQSRPHRAGLGDPRRLGQHPGAQTEAHVAREPGGRDRPRRGPRRRAARRRESTERLGRTPGSACGVATRDRRDPHPLGGLGGLGVEVVDDLHVVGHEPDGDDDHGRGGRLRRELLDAVVHVRLEPGLARRTRAGAEDQLTAQLDTELGADGRVEAPGQPHVLVGVEVALAVTRPGRVVHRERDRVRHVEPRAAEGSSSPPSAATIARTQARPSPGWWTYWRTLSISSPSPAGPTSSTAAARSSRYCRQDE